MQLTARAISPNALQADDGAPTAGNPTVEEYKARCCHVCGGRYPPFGFGPPMTRKEVVIWACLAHRDEVNRRLGGFADAGSSDSKQQSSKPARNQLALF